MIPLLVSCDSLHVTSGRVRLPSLNISAHIREILYATTSWRDASLSPEDVDSRLEAACLNCLPCFDQGNNQ